MPAACPQSAREAWGDQVADDVTRWLEETVRERAVPRDECREVLSRLDVVEHRLDETNARLDRMEERFDARFNQVDERFDRMHEAMRVQTRWTVGTIALFGTIVTVLLAIAQFGG